MRVINSLGYRRALRISVPYVLLLAAAIAAFLVILRLGEGVVAPAPVMSPAERPSTHSDGSSNALLSVLIELAAIIAAARVLGAMLHRVGQPAVVGEVLAGIALGPSLLGRLAPQTFDVLFPPSAAPYLQILAQVGVVLFMFLVGLELDTRHLRQHTRPTIAVSHASIVVPFLLGSVLALWLYPRFSTVDVPFEAFALFLGVAMSVTAFPVLARILTDRGLQATPLGSTALTCAAVDDASAWCLLALAAGTARHRSGEALVTLGLAVGFVVLMVLVVRPVMGDFFRRARLAGEIGQGPFAAALVVLLVSALATHAIGIHALFGSFLAGAIIAPDRRVAAALRGKCGELVAVLLLPAFFAYTGMRTQIGLLDGPKEWLVCSGIVVVACAGKFGGAAVAGRLTGMSWRSASALGILMNTRGLMEMIVLNVGLDLGVIGPTLFTMLIIMAVLTTVLTAPLLGVLIRGHEAAA